MSASSHKRTVASSRKTALEEAARWHERRAAFYRREIERGRKWSREHGEDSVGIYYTEDCPAWIRMHTRSATAMRRLKKSRAL